MNVLIVNQLQRDGRPAGMMSRPAVLVTRSFHLGERYLADNLVAL